MPPVPKVSTPRDSAYLASLRGAPCLVCGAPGEPAHLRTRRNHGDGRENVIPLCRRHHVEQHQHGIRTFRAKYGI